MLEFSASAGPGQRAHFYAQLSTLLGAGLPVLQALEQLSLHSPSSAAGASNRHLLECLHQGMTFTDAFASLPGGIPEFDLALISAGERAGCLDQTFGQLARHLSERAANIRLLLQECAYPVLVLHLAAFIAPLPELVTTHSVPTYLLHVLGPLLTVYLLIGGVMWLLRPRQPLRWRSLVERILLRIPLLGSARTDIALSRLAGTLLAQLSAGILVTEAWPTAAKASGSPLIERVVLGWSVMLDSGYTPSELVITSGIFPELFASTYASGEISGRLEQQLRWLAQHHEEEGFRKLRIASMWAPRLFYGVIALWMVFQILSIAGSYSVILQQLSE